MWATSRPLSGEYGSWDSLEGPWEHHNGLDPLSNLSLPPKSVNNWPALPILIYAYSETSLVSNLEQHDRMCKIDVCGIPNSLLKQVGAMKKPVWIFGPMIIRHLSFPIRSCQWVTYICPEGGIPFLAVPNISPSSSLHDSSSVVPSQSTTLMTKGLKPVRTMADKCFQLFI